MSAKVLLSRLDGVRSTGPGKWIARCPAHEDRSPSLSILEKDDGRVLILDHAGCGAHAVLEAVGLEWSALFPPRDPCTHRTRRAPPVPYRDVLIALRHEAMVVLLCADAALRRELTHQDLDRLAVAVRRIEAATRLAR